MKISVTFTKDVDKVPECCSKCMFGDVCDIFLRGLTKNGGMQWTKAAMTRRHKLCPMKIEGEQA